MKRTRVLELSVVGLSELSRVIVDLRVGLATLVMQSSRSLALCILISVGRILEAF